MRCFKSILLAITAVLFVVACGGGSGGGNTIGETPNVGGNTISSSPNLGLVHKATVNIYQRDGKTLLARTTSSRNGIYVGSVGNYSGPLVVEVVGDNDATYYDEAAGTVIPFRAPNKMYALVPRARLKVAVTPLTDIAYRQARVQKLFPLTACEVNKLNELVRLALAPTLRSILLVLPTRFDGNTTRGSLRADEGGRYAAELAALARLGAGKSAPALAVLNYLRVDVLDGKIDGRINGQLVKQPALYSSYRDFARKLQLQIRRVAAAFGTQALRDIAAQLGPKSGNVNGKNIEDACEPTPPPTGGTGGTGGTGSGGGGI
jgi:hypothetical protein